MIVRLFVALLVATTIYGFENSEILSALKKRELQLDREKLQEESSKLSTDWVERITGSYSDIKNNDTSPNQEMQTYRISISQPIFKSGGIYYGIKYADATRDYGSIGIDKKEQELIKNAISILFQIRKIELRLERERLLLENAKIDVLRKREQFAAGLIDGSLLDSAILDRNGGQNAILETEIQRENLLESFKNLSDKEPQMIELPRFEMIAESEFLEKNIDILESSRAIEQKRYKRNGIITTYLPTLSITAEYVNQDVQNALATSRDYENEYATFGFVLSMPLFDINTKNTIEINHIEYLQASLDLKQKKIEQKNLYQNMLKQLDILDKKERLTEEDLQQYSSLLEDTKARFEAGESTIYDVNVMQNSRDIKKKELEIHDIDRQLKLLELYAKLY